MRPILVWIGVLGIAENTYPHPEGAPFKEVTNTTPLSRVSVKLLTRTFIKYASAPPKSHAI